MSTGGKIAAAGAVGAAVAVGVRALLPRLLVLKFTPAVARLNAGDASALLASYTEDAVLHFNDGPHRWSGDWVGRAAIGRFLGHFTRAGVQGRIRSIAIAGPPWAMTMMARFDDFADGPDGTRDYENRTVLVLRTRWGKIIDHEDFYVDTARIAAFEKSLTARGVAADD